MNLYTDVRPAQRHVSVLAQGGITFGHAQLIVWPAYQEGRYDGEKYACIEDVWVHKDYRDQGHGKALLVHVIETARSLGVSRIYLTARDTEEREAARHIYEKLGFRQTTDGFTLELGENQKTKEEPKGAPENANRPV